MFQKYKNRHDHNNGINLSKQTKPDLSIPYGHLFPVIFSFKFQKLKVEINYRWKSDHVVLMNFVLF